VAILLDDCLSFIHQAFDNMLAIAEELGDACVNQRPNIPEANSPFAIVTHCVGVTQFWFGAVLTGRQVDRDRDAEFQAQGTIAALRQAVQQAKQQVAEDLLHVQADQPLPHPEHLMPRHLERGIQKWRQGSAVLQVLKELTQHLGHMELTRDILLHDME
jgi:hypothetical protein